LKRLFCLQYGSDPLTAKCVGLWCKHPILRILQLLLRKHCKHKQPRTHYSPWEQGCGDNLCKAR